MSDAHYVLKISPADGEATARTIHEDSVVIGRREGDIVIDDDGASGRHAELRMTGSMVEVSDLGSTNGIVWQSAITRGPFSVAEGEWFQIGRTKFTVTSVHIPPTAAAPEPEDEEGEEATAFISPADLGMEDPEPEPEEAEAVQWFYERGSGQQGPVETTALRAMLADGTLSPSNQIWNSALSDWTPARELFPDLSEPQPAATTPEHQEEEEATAWMTAVDGAADDSGWRDEPGPSSPADWHDDAPPTESMEPVKPADYAQDQTRVEQTRVEQPAMMDQAHTDLGAAKGLRPNFRGEGGDLFKRFFIHWLFVMVTAGIYTPWFVCKLYRHLAARTVFGPTQRGWLYLRFHGRGDELFLKVLVGGLLTIVTLGIYGAWFVCDMARWFLERSDAVAEDGTVYQAQFGMGGGELFVTVLVNFLLTIVTLGIYTPWAYCAVRAQVMSHIHVFESSGHVGGFQFVGQGRTLLVLALVQGLLTMVTLGFYAPWAQVKLMQYVNQHTRVYYRERWFKGDFTGDGRQNFVLCLVGILLTPLTLGVYYAWFYANKRAFDTNHGVWHELT